MIRQHVAVRRPQPVAPVHLCPQSSHLFRPPTRPSDVQALQLLRKPASGEAEPARERAGGVVDRVAGEFVDVANQLQSLKRVRAFGRVVRGRAGAFGRSRGRGGTVVGARVIGRHRGERARARRGVRCAIGTRSAQAEIF